MSEHDTMISEEINHLTIEADYTLKIVFENDKLVRIYGDSATLPLRFAVEGPTLTNALRNASSAISAAESTYGVMPSLSRH